MLITKGSILLITLVYSGGLHAYLRMSKARGFLKTDIRQKAFSLYRNSAWWVKAAVASHGRNNASSKSLEPMQRH